MKAVWARPEHSVRGVLASLVLSVFAFPLLIGAAHTPTGETALSFSPASLPAATLSRSGDDLIITGSVAVLFKTGIFAGPNRAEKVARARLTPDGTTVSSGFDEVRTRLASLRTGAPMPAPVHSAWSNEAIAVASIDPKLINPALLAIDDASPNLAPVPQQLSPDLAYARANLPPTDFSVLHDKSGKVVSEKEEWCMAVAIYFEARGEIYRGQVAVGQVVMNRLAHRLYPKTICGVVFQNEHMHNACQFSFACDGRPETITEASAWKQAQDIAKGVIDGSLYLTEVGAATHYHATYVYPDWAPRLRKVATIGHHVFYRFKRS